MSRVVRVSGQGHQWSGSGQGQVLQNNLVEANGQGQVLQNNIVEANGGKEKGRESV